MAFTIGRAGRTLALPNPMVWSDGGGAATVHFIPSIVAPVSDALRLRDQLLGLDNNQDELVVPVVVDAEPRRTGYYRVKGVTVTTDPSAIVKGWFGCDVALEPVQGYANPLIESIINGARLPNAVGAVDGDVVQFHAFPAATEEYYRGAIVSTATRPSADGNISFSLNGTISTPASFSLKPSDFYVGAATFEQGSPLQPVVGRMYAQDDTVNWRLSNGLVRVVPGADATKYSVTYWTGGAWGTPKIFRLMGGGGNLIGPVQSVTVMRNSVEEVTIRLSFAPTSSLKYLIGKITLDMSLRRGDRLVRMYWQTDIATNRRVEVFTPEAATAITYGAVVAGGIRATANDADGNRYVLLSYQAVPTSDLVNGRLDAGGTVTAMDIGIGCEIGGSGAGGTDTAVSIAKQYLAAMAEKQTVVAR